MIVAAPFDWSTYLTLAEELAKRTDEASLRSAVSRTYYSVYHLALARAVANNFTTLSGEGKHAQLWRLFTTSPEPDCMKLGQIAERLKEKRVRADYEPHFARIEEEVPELLNDARDFAVRLQKLNSRYPNPASVRQ